MISRVRLMLEPRRKNSAAARSAAGCRTASRRDQPGGDRLDQVVLACTHFPLLAAELAAAAPRPLGFVDGGAGIARRVAHLLGPVPAGAGGGRAIFTRASAHVDALAGALHSFGLDQVEIL
jgi:glutamate racemase